ncbi:hypothetical protein TDIS_1522 [Thermosulfurimonas dismutans]|uniref:Uncharacterized protein n=1 Tax=Thermosulfurimonas dismutans TaxID=999894 RepID=A0A179D2P0_9BACT|nr:hypothetical protein TDIS_1522 [Thermosulfurimonas dismutans]
MHFSLALPFGRERLHIGEKSEISPLIASYPLSFKVFRKSAFFAPLAKKVSRIARFP